MSKRKKKKKLKSVLALDIFVLLPLVLQEIFLLEMVKNGICLGMLTNKISFFQNIVLQKTHQCSLIHLMRAISCAHASTHDTSLMRVKNNTRHFCLWYLLLGPWNEENERTKTSNWLFGHFSLTSANLWLTLMLYFLVWLQNKEKNSKLGGSTIISLAYINVPVYSS